MPWTPVAECNPLQLDRLRVEIAAEGRRLVPVDGVSLAIGRDECVALLGESGCGKSMTALALMRLLPEGARVAAGALELEGENLFALPEAAMRDVRGGRLAMIFQEPQTSLNPVMSVGQQIAETLAAHRPDADANAVGRELLEAVGLPPERLDAYPFQLSGGQRQRALIAMMLAGEPEVLIADEPTTALDVTVQAQILKLLKDLQRQRGMGLLLITHDLDVAGDMADRVAVMYAGQIVEYAARDALYAQPRHPYTQKLFAVLPRLERRGQRLDSLPGRVPAPDAAIVGCRFAERCPRVFERCRSEAPELLETAPGHVVRCHLFSPPSPSGGRDGDEGATPAQPVMQNLPSLPPLQGAPWPTCQGRSKGSEHAPRNPLLAPSPPPEGEGAKPVVLRLRDLSVHFPLRKGLLRRTVGHFKAVDGVSLTVNAGETLALVGESGCGKTTLARAVLRLIEPTGGTVEMGGAALERLAGEALRQKRREMQIVFQDPFSSLNPRMKVGAILEEGLLALLPELDRASRNARIARLLDQVGLPADAVQRYPHEFSGGQRQRIAIARALAVEPKLLILDEPTSALDVSVQAQILNLLADIQAERGLSYLFITHNLPVVGYLAHRVAVMRAGRIVEEGATEAVLTQPESDYTRLLLESAPGRRVTVSS